MNEFLGSGKTVNSETGHVQFKSERRPINKSPFYSKPMIVGVSLTCGGLSQRDLCKNSIPKLFAVGNTAGGVAPTAERSNTQFGGGFVLR